MLFSVLGVGGRQAEGEAAEYLLSSTISGGEAALPSHRSPARQSDKIVPHVAVDGLIVLFPFLR